MFQVIHSNKSLLTYVKLYIMNYILEQSKKKSPGNLKLVTSFEILHKESECCRTGRDLRVNLLQ